MLHEFWCLEVSNQAMIKNFEAKPLKTDFTTFSESGEVICREKMQIYCSPWKAASRKEARDMRRSRALGDGISTLILSIAITVSLKFSSLCLLHRYQPIVFASVS